MHIKANFKHGVDLHKRIKDTKHFCYCSIGIFGKSYAIYITDQINWFSRVRLIVPVNQLLNIYSLI